MEKLTELAKRVESKASDLEFIRVRGNRAQVRIANPATGGDIKKVSRQWLEDYETELDAM